MLNGIIVIVQKEIKDALRDPGSLIAAALYTLMGPLVVWVLLIIMNNQTIKSVNKDIEIVGLEQQSVISAYLTENGFNFIKNANVRVIFPEDLTTDVDNGKQVTIRIEADMSKSAETVNILEMTLKSYSQLITEDRLKTQNIAFEYILPLDIQIENSSETSFQDRSIISLMTLSFFMAIAFTGMSLSIDMTAGERERLTLEPLLAQPISTATIMIGKWVTAFFMAMAGSVTTITVLAIILSFTPTPDIEIHLNIVTAIKIFILLIPISALFAALQLSLALFAKSYKEGISYLSMLGLAPMMASFLGDDFLSRYDFLPLLHEASIIKKILLENNDSIFMPNVAILISIVLTIMCIFYSQRRLKQETLLS